MREKAERANSVRDGDNDYAFVREPVTPVQGMEADPLMYPPP